MSIRDMYSAYLDSNEIPKLEEDPFLDTPQPQLIGIGYYKLEALSYLIDNPYNIQLISYDKKKNKNLGKVEVNIIPVDETGWGEI